MEQLISARVTTDVITVEMFNGEIANLATGAIVTFSGVVRNHDHGRDVSSLEYEAHPDAQTILLKVANEIAAKYSVQAVCVAHRHGLIPMGESALIAVVSSAHRQDAFAACSELVDEVKNQIPIWKHQVFVDGTDEWVNSA